METATDLAASIFRLPTCYPPKTILADPERIKNSVIEYFSLCKMDETLRPTPPGLAMAMGFRSFDSLMRVMKTEEEAPGSYPEESMLIVDMARSYLEDFYIQAGLREVMPKEFIRFLLSSYFARSEKIAGEDRRTDTNFTVNIQGATNNTVITLEDL